MRRFSARLAIATLVLIVPSPGALHAQHTRSSSVGVMGGLSLTTMVGKDAADDLEKRTRPLAGLTLVSSWTATPFGFEVDGLYAGKGFRSSGATSSFDFNSSFVELPVLLRINLAPNAPVHAFLSAGAAVGVRIDCSATLSSGTDHETRSCTKLAALSQQDIGMTDVSGVIGGGVTTKTGALQLTLATRYTRGFKSVIGDVANYNQALSVYLGLSRAVKGAVRASVGR